MHSADASHNIYRTLGLIENPFIAPDRESYDPIGTTLSIQNAGNALLAAVEVAATSPDHRPVIINKSEDIPMSYHSSALADALGRMTSGEYVNVLQVYVPINMMRVGRVRAILNVTAERTAYTNSSAIIGSWAAAVAQNPDTEIHEWEAVAASEDATALLSSAEADPEAFSNRVFGEAVTSREGADDYEIMMRISTARQERLERDPAQPDEDSGPEDATDDPMAAAFVTPLGEMHDHELAAGDAPKVEDVVADYLCAYASARLSPVLGRALRAYRAQGIASMAEELKVSKAPTKTLIALCQFVSHYHDAVAVVLDRFDMFEVADEQLKTDIATTLFQLRWTLKDWAAFVLILPPGLAPQIEESFGTATRVDWDFRELAAIEKMDSPFSAQAALTWLQACSITEQKHDWFDAFVHAVPDGTEASAGYAALRLALEVAASESRQPTEPDVLSALEQVGLSDAAGQQD